MERAYQTSVTKWRFNLLIGRKERAYFYLGQVKALRDLLLDYNVREDVIDELSGKAIFKAKEDYKFYE